MDQALLLGKGALRGGKQPVLFLEHLGTVEIHRQDDIRFCSKFRDLVLLEAQLRLLVHSAASAVEGREVEGYRLFSQDRRESEAFSIDRIGRKIRRWLADLGGTDGFALDSRRIGSPDHRGVVRSAGELVCRHRRYP